MNKLMSELIYILQLLWLCLRVVFHSIRKNILHRNTFQENLFRYWNNLICITVGISNGVAIPAKSSVTNKRAQFVVLESKKALDFFSRNDALGISQKSKKIKTILNYWKLCILDLFSINDALGNSQNLGISNFDHVIFFHVTSGDWCHGGYR